MKARVFLFAALLIMSTSVSHGQLGKLLKKSTERVVANTAEQVAQKEANRAVDSAFQRRERKILNDTTGNDSKGGERKKILGFGKLLNGNANIKYNDEYDFDGRIYTQMEMYDKKEPVKSDYYIYFNSNKPNAGIEFRTTDNEGDKSAPVSTVMVYDYENRCFLMLMDGKDSKTGFASTLPSDSVMQARKTAMDKKVKTERTNVKETGSDYTPPTIVKTGNSKIIAGYRCDEYKVTEAEKKDYGFIWLTKDLNLKTDKSHWNKAGLPGYYSLPEFEGSTMLAMESYDENNKLTMKMETKEINPHFSHKIETKGYTLIKWDFNRAMKK